MTAYLVDTNVVSELVRVEKNANVLRFVAENADLWFSTVVVHELRYGVERMPPGGRRDDLQVTYETMFTDYAFRILPFDRDSAEWAARFRVTRERAGLGVDWGDILIAGTARAFGLTVATRNVHDYELLEVDVVNQWDEVT